jgi:hypothetical protein
MAVQYSEILSATGRFTDGWKDSKEDACSGLPWTVIYVEVK